MRASCIYTKKLLQSDIKNDAAYLCLCFSLSAHDAMDQLQHPYTVSPSRLSNSKEIIDLHTYAYLLYLNIAA